VAVGVLVSRCQQELERARLHANWLLTEFDRGACDEHAARVVEIITDREAIGQRVPPPPHRAAADGSHGVRPRADSWHWCDFAQLRHSFSLDRVR